MGKVCKYTGSKLLGEELRRLRGARSLADIAELSRQSPLTSRVTPVSMPTLSQTENGITMPGSEMLYSLSVLYNVSPARLLNLIVEERLTSGIELPEGRDEIRARLQHELQRGNWYEGLALAIHGGRQARDASDLLMWQSQRAFAMRKLGMRNDAIMMLMEIAESRDLRAEHEHIPCAYLAEVLTEAGYFKAAYEHLDRALASSGAQASTMVRARLEVLRIRVLLEQHAYGLRNDEALLREAHRGIPALRMIVAADSVTRSLLLDAYEAIALGLLGNHVLAIRDLTAVAERAAELGDWTAEVHSWMSIGDLRRKQGRRSDAMAAYLKAENRAMLGKQSDEAFEVYFRLRDLAAETADPRFAFFHGRCLRFWPLAQRRSPNVVEFESILRAGGTR